MSKKFSSAEFNQLLEDLYDLQRLGIKVGLEHTKELLKFCGNPQNKFRSIHIAGTNGKGSTAAMLASILYKLGNDVGLYTSPHLINFNERIRVNGIPISDEDIVDFMSQYKSGIDKIESTFFEATTAMAFTYFNKKNVDIAVIETGLGGRLDSTNVLQPDVTIITPITSDHTEILGKDIKTIAFEKGGIIKKNTPLILSPQNGEVKRVMIELAEQKEAKIIYCNQRDLTKIKLDETGTSFNWKEKQYRTKLIGEHQASNAVLAIEASKKYENTINDEIIREGLQNVIWPARMQKMHTLLPIYYDVAHNPHGIQILLDTLNKMYTEKPVGVMVLKADKELDQIVPKLKNRFKELIITSQIDEGLMNAEALYHSLTNYGIKALLEPDIKKAIRKLNNLISDTVPGIIFGSHYVGKTVFKEYGFSFDNGYI